MPDARRPFWNRLRAGAVSGRLVHLDIAATAIPFGATAVYLSTLERARYLVKPLGCAMAIVLCAGYTSPASAVATGVAFESVCSTTTGRGTSATSYRRFVGWSDRFVSIAGPEPMTTTSAHDPVRQAFSTSAYYRSREGDETKGFAQALYDPRHRVLALCRQDDAWTSFSLVANVPPPPFTVAHADLAGVATRHGLHLGSSIADVEAVYGRSRPVRVDGRPPQLSYLRLIPMPGPSGVRVSPESAEMWFAIVNGHVASISLGAGF